ncbi:MULTISPECIES: inositol monophosphatase family protein [unclassified Bosea (in: a-proteobacteria)]|uniref:3'(2'),5'-bisphosphate nucleotidase CysQ family protein n=1 Tax=unclassified Bosea (in: a-proteobacteria) TaxID=2653178 RepID=UPI000953C02E|nr:MULTISPECIES: inositol monophosphatase family protein [unclassified Bosea (in: a-proteobacteria)]TAJ28509.1 MAG: 3'(2'),5'-bisphosphate nucleotidase CysQ [Bosea sp. (in: a-proteobacteria)]SIQ35275.1 3'(2'),5'-bisphosphate nucleotidase [Bosea sp. TND4EK4]
MIGRDDPRLRDRDAIARKLAEAARAAAIVLLQKRAAYEVKLKMDGSPVCTADLAADDAAKAALARLAPGFPVVSEETVESAVPGPVFILLDPLDGTREFLAGGDSYCVAIAVVVDERPVAGAIAAPALGRLWFGGEHAYTQEFGPDGAVSGAARQVEVRALPPEGPRVLVSRFHGGGHSEGVAASLCKGEAVPMSSAVKFGLIASGEADLHVRCGQTMEWDTAAGDAILAAAGGVVLTLDGAVPRYGVAERQFRNPPFVAASSEALARRVIDGDAAACC